MEHERAWRDTQPSRCAWTHASTKISSTSEVEQLGIAHVLQLLRHLIRRLEETLREDIPGGGFDPDFLFVVPGDDDGVPVVLEQKTTILWKCLYSLASLKDSSGLGRA